MTEYLAKDAALRLEAADRPSDLLETLYMANCYRAGKDLRYVLKEYDTAIWDGVSSAELLARLEDLSRFMATLARDRLSTWGVRH